VFRIRTEEEIRKKQARRKKRAQEKGKSKNKNKDIDDAVDDAMNIDQEINVIDLFTPYLVVRASAKVRSFDFGSKEVASKPGVQVSVGSIEHRMILTYHVAALCGFVVQCS
jgi:U3 small nucleolar RNA-associated protein 12